MAGIYIHIPFCRKVCFYCDFHFTVSLKNKEKILDAILKEMEQRKDYCGEDISTIYLGGGTPSVLNVDELTMLFEKMDRLFSIRNDAEITMETNPDDLSLEYLMDLKKHTPVNRLSIGIQSFHDKYLIWMNRRHGGKEAEDAVLRAQRAGFKNITADLIYGIPGLTAEEWYADIEKMTALNIPHISAYHLTIEANTILGRRHKKGHVKEIDDKESFAQFQALITTLMGNGFEHYEISNFAKPGYYSKHNTNYWKQQKYAGFGPSAHSYNGRSRQWNIKVNTAYIDKVNAGNDYFEMEKLKEKDRYNEYVMVSLRTMWGSDLEFIRNNFGQHYAEHFFITIESFVNYGYVNVSGSVFTLNLSGKFIADHIAAEVFM